MRVSKRLRPCLQKLSAATIRGHDSVRATGALALTLNATTSETQVPNKFIQAIAEMQVLEHIFGSSYGRDYISAA